jgi:glyoxylase-like metal-dependent hydrolase (beta-lactamase superfamily II)
MIRIQKFVFNSFQVNTYILYDETAECIIVDAANSDDKENREINDFIEKNKLKPVRNLCTHCHIDHILGNGFFKESYGISPEYHQASEPFFFTVREIAGSFGYNLNHIPEPKGYLKEDDKIHFGTSELHILYTPGHAEGSVCFYSKDQEFVITGDVLFRDTIGRTDLPSGNFELLMKSIKNKLFALPDATIVYPGHGPETNIGYEKRNNPFIR